MYICVRALLRQRGDNQRLTETQVGSASVRTLLHDNAVVYLVLTNPAIDHEVGLDLSTIADIVYNLNENTTVDQWLVSLDTASLPTSDTVLVKEVGVVGYNDIFAAGYSLELISPISGPGSQLPQSELTDILVTKSGLDYELLYQHCLVTVNGLLHLTDSSTSGMTVKDAGKSIGLANRHDIGLISFLDVGAIATVPITPEMVLSYTGGSLENGFLIALPDIDLSNKVVMLSVGGYLHFSNECYLVVGDHSILFQWWKYPLAHRFYNANKLIDMTPFTDTLVKNPDHGEALDLNQANSDESIRAFMSLSQSFVILLDADNFYFERHGLERTGLPGRYYNYELPKYPMQLETGLLPAYVAMPEDGMYSLAINSNLVRSFQHDTKRPTDDQYFNDARISSNLGYYASAYLLEMGTEFLTEPTLTPSV